MMKRAFAIALLGLGTGFFAHDPASAAPPSGATGLAALQARNMSDDMVVRTGGRCFELPVVGAVVAFVELLRDEEFDHTCGEHSEGDYYAPGAHEEGLDVTAKGGAYANPEHAERARTRGGYAK
jgi:hypothetical protein